MLEIPSSSGQTHNSMMIDFTLRSIKTNNSLSKHLNRVLAKVPDIRPRSNQNKSTLTTTLTKFVPSMAIELNVKEKKNTNTIPAYQDVKHRTMTRQLRIRYKQPRSPMPRFKQPDYASELDSTFNTKKDFFRSTPTDPYEHTAQLNNFLNTSSNVFVFDERPRTNYRKKNQGSSSNTIKRPLPSSEAKLPKEEFITTTFTTLEDVLTTHKTPASLSPNKKFFLGRLEPNIVQHFPVNLPEYEIVTGKDGPNLRIKKDLQKNIFSSKPKAQMRLNTVTLTDTLTDTLPSTKNDTSMNSGISRTGKLFSRFEDKGKSHSPTRNVVDPNFPVEGKQLRKRRDTNGLLSPEVDYYDAYNNIMGKGSSQKIKVVPS